MSGLLSRSHINAGQDGFGNKSGRADPIALVDCNDFYASCERVFQQELSGKPVVVRLEVLESGSG